MAGRAGVCAGRVPLLRWEEVNTTAWSRLFSLGDTTALCFRGTEGVAEGEEGGGGFGCAVWCAGPDGRGSTTPGAAERRRALLAYLAFNLIRHVASGSRSMDNNMRLGEHTVAVGGDIFRLAVRSKRVFVAGPMHFLQEELVRFLD